MSRRAHVQGLESRRRILDAALDLAAERGYDGTTIALVSARSALPASSIYWHFADKETLLAAAMEHGAQGWRSSLVAMESVPAGKTFPEVVRDRVLAGARATGQRPAYARFGTKLLLESRPEEPAARRFYRAVHADVRASLTRWWTDVLPEDARDPELAERLSDLHLAVIEGIYLSGPPEQVVEALAEALTRGLLAEVERWRTGRAGG